MTALSGSSPNLDDELFQKLNDMNIKNGNMDSPVRLIQLIEGNCKVSRKAIQDNIEQLLWQETPHLLRSIAAAVQIAQILITFNFTVDTIDTRRKTSRRDQDQDNDQETKPLTKLDIQEAFDQTTPISFEMLMFLATKVAYLRASLQPLDSIASTLSVRLRELSKVNPYYELSVNTMTVRFHGHQIY